MVLYNLIFNLTKSFALQVSILVKHPVIEENKYGGLGKKYVEIVSIPLLRTTNR